MMKKSLSEALIHARSRILAIVFFRNNCLVKVSSLLLLLSVFSSNDQFQCNLFNLTLASNSIDFRLASLMLLKKFLPKTRSFT